MWQGDKAAWIRVGAVWRGSLKTRPRENIEEKRSHNKLPYMESLTNIVAVNMARPFGQNSPWLQLRLSSLTPGFQ